MLEEQDGVTGYRDSPEISENGQGKVTPGADPKVDNHS